MSGYDPRMDDPDWRRKKQSQDQARANARRRKTMEAEEEFDDYEDPEVASERAKEIDDQIKALKREQKQIRKMSTGPGNGVGGAIANAMAAGAKTAAAAQLNETMTSALKKGLVSAGMLTEDQANSMGVEMLLKIGAPIVLLYLTEKFPQMVPQHELLHTGASLALQAGTTEVLQPALMLMTPMLKSLAAGTVEATKQIEEAGGEIPKKQQDPEMTVSQDD